MTRLTIPLLVSACLTLSFPKLFADPGSGDTVLLQLDREAAALRAIPSPFLGFSIDYGQVTDVIGSSAASTNTLLRDFLLRLRALHGPPVLRFGGRSTFATAMAGEESLPAEIAHLLTPDSLAAIDTLLEESGGQAVFELNTHFLDAGSLFQDMAEGIATHIAPERLAAFELGSSSNTWASLGYRDGAFAYADYVSETHQVLSDYGETGLTVPLVGPSMSLITPTLADDSAWHGQLASYQNTFGSALGAFSQILYPFSATASEGTPRFLSRSALSDFRSSRELAEAFTSNIDLAHSAGHPFWVQEFGLTETPPDENSWWLSDLEEPALWFAHQAFSLLSAGADRVSLPITPYRTSPLSFSQNPDSNAWEAAVRSVYFGLEVVAHIAGKNRDLLPITVSSDNDAATAWATRADDGTLHLLVVKRLKRDLQIRLEIPGAIHAAKIVELDDDELLNFGGLDWDYDQTATSATPTREAGTWSRTAAPDAEGTYRIPFSGGREPDEGLIWIMIPPTKDHEVNDSADDPGTGAFVESSGTVAFEAESLESIAAGSDRWADHSWSPIAGTDASLQTFMRSVPEADLRDREAVDAPAMEYPIAFTTPGTYHVWVRMRGIDRGSDSLHVGFEASVTGLNGIRQNDSPDWLWIGEVPGEGHAQAEVDAPGIKTFRIWPREDGVEVDRIVLALDSDIDPATIPNSARDGAPQALHAHAGENRIFADSPTFTLDGSASTGPIASYHWELLAGGNATFLTDTDGPSPTVNLSTTRTYLFRLTVKDALGNEDRDHVTIRYESLIADAGNDRSGLLGDPIYLDARQSLGTIAHYDWEILDGPASATIEDPNASWTPLILVEAGFYHIRLTITNDEGESRTDDVLLSFGNPPVGSEDAPFVEMDGILAFEAEAASAQSPGTGTWAGQAWAVASDSDASANTFMRLAPGIGLTDPSATQAPTLEFPIEVRRTGSYHVRVRMRGHSDAASIHLGTTHAETYPDGVLAGSGSSWQWSPPADISLPFGPTIFRIWPMSDGVEIDRIAFVYAYRDDPDPDPDNLANSVRLGDPLPDPADGVNVRAVAGENLTVTAGEPFTLDGTASTGPITAYQWTLFQNSLRISNASPTLTRQIPSPGHYWAELKVTNDLGDSHIDVISIHAQADTSDYDAWVSQVYASDTPASERTFHADPDGDGISNVLAFLLGSDHQTLSDPTARFTTSLEDNCLVFAYPRREIAGFPSLELETSIDHHHWLSAFSSPTPTTFAITPDHFGAGIDLVQAQIRIDGMPRVFLRLCVDHP